MGDGVGGVRSFSEFLYLFASTSLPGDITHIKLPEDLLSGLCWAEL